MAFHSTNFGSFSRGLRPFIDKDGYVPEDGDRQSLFIFEGEQMTNSDWRYFVMKAVSATEEAVEDLKHWRKGSVDLKDAVIKLARENPELRKHLVPLIRQAKKE